MRVLVIVAVLGGGLGDALAEGVALVGVGAVLLGERLAGSRRRAALGRALPGRVLAGFGVLAVLLVSAVLRHFGLLGDALAERVLLVLVRAVLHLECGLARGGRALLGPAGGS